MQYLNIFVRLEVFTEVVMKSYLRYAVFFLALLFDPENGSYMFCSSHSTTITPESLILALFKLLFKNKFFKKENIVPPTSIYKLMTKYNMER
jgi:hypothetical protein